jgi:hypothetical protein
LQIAPQQPRLDFEHFGQAAALDQRPAGLRGLAHNLLGIARPSVGNFLHALGHEEPARIAASAPAVEAALAWRRPSRADPLSRSEVSRITFPEARAIVSAAPSAVSGVA